MMYKNLHFYSLRYDENMRYIYFDKYQTRYSSILNFFIYRKIKHTCIEIFIYVINANSHVSIIVIYNILHSLLQ